MAISPVSEGVVKIAVCVKQQGRSHMRSTPNEVIGMWEARNRMARKKWEEPMPTIEGKQARVWIDAYAKKAGKLAGVAKAVRALVKKIAKGSEEYVNPWKIPSFDSHGPLCCFMVGKEHVTFAFMRGAALPDPEKLLEGTGKGVRHVKLRSVADVNRPGVKKLLAAAATLNRKDPPSGMMVGMEKRKAQSKKK
jgi:hypothetical protein